MTVAQDIAAVAEQDESGGQLFQGRWIRRLTLNALLGILLILVNFPKLLKALIDASISRSWIRSALYAPIDGVQYVLKGIIGTDASGFYTRAMTCSFLLLWVFFGLLVILSIRRRGYRLLLSSLAGMVMGYIAVHSLSWIAVAIAVAIGGVVFAVKWVGATLVAIFKFLMLGPILLGLIALGLLVVLFINRRFILRQLRKLVDLCIKYSVQILSAVGLSVLVYVVAPHVYRWILLPIWRFVLLPVLHFLWMLVSFIFAVAIVLIGSLLLAVIGIVTLALLGSLMVSQLQAAWHAGRGVRAMLVAGFAIGSALSLLVLVSVATPLVADSLNQAMINPLGLFQPIDYPTHLITDTFVSTLPKIVREFIFTYLTSLQAPTFDCFVFLVVMVLAATSVLFRVFSAAPLVDDDVSVQYVAKEYLMMAGGLLVGMILIFLQALSGDSSAST